MSNLPTPAEKFEYIIIDGTVKITGNRLSETDTEIRIPETILTFPVTAIGRDAFEKCIRLTSVTIPDSITVIEKGAFSKCFNLEEIILPAGLTDI